MAIQFKTPSSIKDLILELNSANENTYLLGGGTDLIIKLRNKGVKKGTLVDLKGIDELNYVEQIKEKIHIGSSITFADIIENKALCRNFPCLIQAVGQIGSVQIRNTATIGGNIANAFAGADAIPPLMALGAKLKILDSEGDFFIKEMDDIVIGSGKNSLNYNEALVEIQIPVPNNEYRSAFGKIGSRARVSIAKLNMAVVVKVSDANYIEDARVVLGSLGKKAFHSDMAQEVLVGKKVSKELSNEFKYVLAKQVDHAIPTRKSAPYKREAIKGLGEEVFNKLFPGVE